MSKFYITTPIYYVNSRPHIGHAYTTIIAQVLANYQRLRLGQDNVFFLTGTDEHGLKIYQIASLQNKDPKIFCDEVAQQFKDSWQSLEIDYDHFIRTTDQSHEDFVKSFISKLKENSSLYEGEYEGLYCVGCEKFLTAKDLVDNKCPYHQKEPEKIKEKNWFFNLEKYLDQVKTLIETDQIEISPANAKKEVLGLFKQGITDFSVSREKDKVAWGIPLPWDPTQLVYVWCDALTNYISAIDTAKWWPADLHVLGKDILKFHAVYWPAMLLAAGFTPPKKLFIHGFFTINGQKMSKSLGNTIYPEDLVNIFGAEATKYLLLGQFPCGADGDFNLENIKLKYNAKLVNGLGNLVNRIISLTEQNFKERSVTGATLEEFKLYLNKSWDDYTYHMTTTLELDACQNVIEELIDFCDQAVSKNELWKLVKTDPEKAKILFYNLLETVRHLAWMVKPFMPKTADKILEQLGIKDAENKKKIDKAAIWQETGEFIHVHKTEMLFAKLP